MEQLKIAMLTAQTLGELYSLMEDYSYQEFMELYHQLPLQQQARLKAIDARDNYIQLVAITPTSALSVVESGMLLEVG